MGYSTSTEEAAKALHAISALIRNNVNGQEAFHSENGGAMLQVTTFFDSGPVWQGFGSSKNSSGSGSSDGAASLVELEPF